MPQRAPQGSGGGEEEDDKTYSQWVSFFLGFYSCLAGRHAWAAAEGVHGGDEEEEELLLLEGMRRGSTTGKAAGAVQRPMSAMHRPLFGSAGAGGLGVRSASSLGPESEDDEEDDEDERTRASGTGAPPDFLTDEDDAVFLPEATQTGSLLGPSSSSVSEELATTSSWAPAPALAGAAAPAPSTMRLVLALTLPLVEIKLLDREQRQRRPGDAFGEATAAAAAAAAAEEEEEEAVHGWALSMHNVRIESIRGGGLVAPGSHPSENVYQARFGHFELRVLGADGEPLPGRPALLRPMLQDPVSSAADHAHFPEMLQRGVRDEEEDGEGEGKSGDSPLRGGGEAALTGDGASLLLRHHLRTDALALKLHTFIYPPPPPPHVASNLEAHIARRLHIVADLPAWRGLAAFVSKHTDPRCLSGDWAGTVAQAFPLQPMPSGGIRNVVLRLAGLTVRLPSLPTAEGRGGGFTLACGAASLLRSPALPRSFLDAPAAAGDNDDSPTALDARLLEAAAAAMVHVNPAVRAVARAGSGLRTLAPWRMQLTLSDVRVLASVTAAADWGEEGSLTALIDPVAVHLLLSIDASAAAAAEAGGGRRVIDDGAFYVPLDEASSLSVSFACLGPLCIRLQPQVCTHARLKKN